MQVHSAYSSGEGEGEDTVRFPFGKAQGTLTGATGRCGQPQSRAFWRAMGPQLHPTFVRTIGLSN